VARPVGRPEESDPLRALVVAGRRGAHHHQVQQPRRRPRQRRGSSLPRNPAGRRSPPHAFYARFQDEVVAAPAEIAAHVERSRREVSDAFRQLFDVALVEAHEQLVAAPGDLTGKGPLRNPLPPDPRSHPRPDVLQIHRHIGCGVWFLRETVRARPEQADTIRQTLRELLPHAADSLKLPADGDASELLGIKEEDLRTFALGGLTRRLSIIGVPIETVLA
jgi:hypothetical protein